ncbi:MAG: YhdP family protein [Gammaproteobacteria bacterium]|nr:YhdP family protein [Gammaproteobacteria bacterium]
MSLSPVGRFSRSVWASAWYAFAAVAVLLATGFALARLLLPFAEQYNTELSQYFGDRLGQPVRMRSLDAEWHGWGPSLVLQDVALLDAGGQQPVVRLDKILLGLDLLTSLRQWQPVFSNITLVGVDLVLARNAQGQFSVAGLAGQATAEDAARRSAEAAPFMAWLFSQGRVSLENSNITWHDEMGAGNSMHFSSVNLSLQNDGDRHQLDASVSLSRNLGKSLQLRVDMWGDPLSPNGRRTRLYVSGEHVRLAELFEAQRLGEVDVSIKSAGFQVWGQWQEGVLQRLSGDIEAAGLALRSSRVSAAPQSLLLDRMAGTFAWQRTAQGWQFEGDELMLARETRKWQPARLSLQYAQRDGAAPTLDAAVSYLQLEDIAELLTLFAVGGERLEQPLQAIRPRGEISHAILHWQGGEATQYQAYATLRGATVEAWRHIPAAVNVEGQLWLDSMGGQVALQHAAVTLDFPTLFRWPLSVNELRGHVAWEVEDEQWRVAGRNLQASNADVTASATLDVIRHAHRDSPFMSLVVDFQDGDGSQVAHYLPAGIMSAATVAWLDEAFVSARIVSGGSVFHGYLADFPFDDGQGKFAVEFAVDNASLNYADAWPPITGISADVRFEGRGMFVEMHRGTIFSNQIQWAKIGIENMTVKPLLLSVDGEVSGDTQEKLDYLVASPPLYAAFGQHLQQMNASGDSVLQLDLDLPIGGGDELKVKGWVDLQENTLTIPPLGQVLTAVEGRLHFFQDGLLAENIQAELLGQPTRIDIATQELGASRKLRIKAGGPFAASDLAARYVPLLDDLLTGNGQWDVVFDIPVREREKPRPLGDSDAARSPSAPESAASLYVKADLKDVAARLPQPFDKDAGEAAGLELRIVFAPEQVPVMRVSYAGFVDTVLTLGGMTAADDLRAEVRFNAGSAVLPDAPGVQLSGWLDTVSLDEWRNLLLSRASPPSSGQSPRQDAEPDVVSGGGQWWLRSADVAARVFEAYGQQLHNARVEVRTEDAAWTAQVEAKELKGNFIIPYDRQKWPVSADLAYCYLEKLEVGGAATDPRAVPALDIRVDDFRFQNSRFGKLRLETTRVADGLRIEQLVLRPQATTVTARGGWYIRGNQQQSNMTMHLESSNIGRTLKALDYVGGIDKGEGVVDLGLAWPGSLFDLDAQRIRGHLTLAFKNGYVLDVDPGAGRMFGMLSIQTLPRRLMLDFSDVFKKGFSFDRIRGSFQIEGGDAYTNNLYMEGPAARVEIAGRTGLAQQDYDQLVTVTPHVADTLPVLGFLTATPQVGAAILAFQKLFQPNIDDVTRNQYTITGSWNAPQIDKVKTARPVAEGE